MARQKWVAKIVPVTIARLNYVLLCLVLIAPPAFTQTEAGQAQKSGNQFDGPAELPRLRVLSALADTPAPGHTRVVKDGSDLQSALDGAKCGDMIALQAGTTFSGRYFFPNKHCDDGHWIIVRTSAPDNELPPEGSRMSPCFAGIGSLPGRPDLHCAAVKNVLAKIELDQKAEAGPIILLDGANHYRFIGLEITRSVPELHVRNLVQPKDPDTTANHLVFDRLWVHGTAQDETKGGIHLSGTTYVVIVDSYFSDFHCIAFKGTCTDAQAINGGGGDSPGGPYKIENNFLEASGQSVMFGGAGGSTTPADIEIRHNYLFKPLIWQPGNPQFVGAYTGNPFIVKNHFELKNAQRVLFEDNVLENCWGGFSQTGFSILLNPGNQGGHCPLCRVTDVTIRYNVIRHVASALQMADVGPGGHVASAGERYSIHDLLVEDIEGQALKGFGIFATIISREPTMRDVRIDHVTAFPLRAVLTVINTGDKFVGLSVTNSIFDAGENGMRSAGGGQQNCTGGGGRQDPADILNECFAHPVFTHNLIIGNVGKWPEGNTSVKDRKAAGLWRRTAEQTEEFRVCSEKGETTSCSKTSPAFHAGTDQKDLGADIDAIESHIRGVL